jgi:hypothetical protein
MATSLYSKAVLISLMAITGCSENSASTKFELAQNSKPVSTYEECVAAGFPVLKTFPGRCVTDQGVTFTAPAPTLNNKNEECVGKCGDGECAEVACMGTGCPCPETAQTCPEDCKAEVVNGDNHGNN